MFAGILVGVGTGKNNKSFFAGGQRNGSADGSSGSNGSFNNFDGSFVDNPMIERFEFDTDVITFGHIFKMYGRVLNPPVHANDYFMTSTMAPAPTVKPPSRIAKR